jgi:hypothetical protein
MLFDVTKKQVRGEREGRGRGRGKGKRGRGERKDHDARSFGQLSPGL